MIVLFNKPYGVVSQFSPDGTHPTLADYIDIKNVYPAGRLDHDSEGLLLLTDDGKFQASIADPKNKLPKTYWVQVDRDITEEALEKLRRGVEIKFGKTKPALVNKFYDPPQIWDRNPPIRYRKNVSTSWIEITIFEGKNRQVRRMTAAVGFPTLRLIRVKIGEYSINNIDPGKMIII